MDITPIHSEQDYKAALKEVSGFFDNEPEPGSPDGDRFEIMLTLLEAYEAKAFQIEAADPIEAIRFRMEQAGLEAKDLASAIGRTNRVYEVLTGKRALTVKMIRNLRNIFGIPADSLIGVDTRKPIRSVPGNAAKQAHDSKPVANLQSSRKAG